MALATDSKALSMAEFTIDGLIGINLVFLLLYRPNLRHILAMCSMPIYQAHPKTLITAKIRLVNNAEKWPPAP